jgi:hypothetical protein
MTATTIAPAEPAVLEDLAAFARTELAAGDIEPWAAVLRAARDTGLLPDAEAAAWAVKAYNAYDDLTSAWALITEWPTPGEWAEDPGGVHAADWPCGRERRNLRGGLVVRHFASYWHAISPYAGQAGWLAEAYPPGTPPGEAFGPLLRWLRQVWGTGRQAAFEWAEFAAKVLGAPVDAPHGALWESSGPRESLQRIYGNAAPDPGWLEDAAHACRDHLARHGAVLTWWDFETVICDFNVMRKGRYYPGQHLGMIREEIAAVPGPARVGLAATYAAAIPASWHDAPAGVDKALARHYAATGEIRTPPGCPGVIA